MNKKDFINSFLSNVKRHFKKRFKRAFRRIFKKKFKGSTDYSDSNILKIWIEAWENGHDWAEKAWTNTDAEVIAGNWEFRSLKEALLGAFMWSNSPEKHYYWQKIYDSLDD